MTQPYPPPPGGPVPGGWPGSGQGPDYHRPAAGWGPAPTGGRPPTQPFGTPPPSGPPPGWAPRPPRPPRPGARRAVLVAVITALVIGLAVGGMIWSAAREDRQVAQQASPSQSAPADPPTSAAPRSPSASPSPTGGSSGSAPANGTEIAFASSEGEGQLKVNRRRWDGDTLLVNVTITSTRGDISYLFGGFGADGYFIDADDSLAPSDPVGIGDVADGESVTGWVALPLFTKGDTTLTMSNDVGEQVTALRIPE